MVVVRNSNSSSNSNRHSNSNISCLGWRVGGWMRSADEHTSVYDNILAVVGIATQWVSSF